MRSNARIETLVDQTESKSTRRSVAVNLAEALGLGIAACVTGSFALRAQTADNVAELAVGVFLCIGVLSSARPSDDTHPLGYGQERFFWSLFAALGIFVGGGGLAIEGAIRSALHPSPIGSYLIAYLVLGATMTFDTFALMVALPPLQRQAAERGLSLRSHLLRNSDPASTTVTLSGGCSLIGGLVAGLGVIACQVTGSSTPDTVASATIGLLLLVTSAFLLRTNRELLTGRGIAPTTLTEMRKVVLAQAGVISVPDLFAVYVGPSSVIVNGDIIFADELAVPAVEGSIIKAAADLRARWPSIEFVYLTPVPLTRPRRVRRPRRAVAKGA